MKSPPLTVQRNWREKFFLVSVWFKGLDGFLEVVAGVALLSVSPAFLLAFVQEITYQHISDDPHDRIAHALLSAATKMFSSSNHFIAVYMLTHGVVKLALVWGLLRRVLFTYPLSIAVFVGFIAYQVYRFTFAPSAGLIALTLLDIVVIVLIYLEYRALLLRAPCSGHSTPN